MKENSKRRITFVLIYNIRIVGFLFLSSKRFLNHNMIVYGPKKNWRSYHLVL